MEEMLLKFNYVPSLEENEWNKDIWTIRYYNDEIEAFNTPRINTPGKYYKCAKTIENLEQILTEIEDL